MQRRNSISQVEQILNCKKALDKIQDRIDFDAVLYTKGTTFPVSFSFSKENKTQEVIFCNTGGKERFSFALHGTMIDCLQSYQGSLYRMRIDLDELVVN